jgi:succinate dehydrogenase hydrophobic anchor subunit
MPTMVSTKNNATINKMLCKQVKAIVVELYVFYHVYVFFM